MKHFLKQLCDFLKLFQFNWKPWFIPDPIDTQKDDEKTQRQKKIFNFFFGALFCVVAICAALVGFPTIKKMLSFFFVVVITYIAFCTIMNSLKIKKKNSGRKTKQKTDSFPELFISSSDYDMVDSFVKSQYSIENKMTTSDCHCLLEIIRKNNMVCDKSLDPMVTLFAKQFPDIFPTGVTNRAITKAKVYKEQESNMEIQLFQNSSKK